MAPRTTKSPWRVKQMWKFFDDGFEVGCWLAILVSAAMVVVVAWAANSIPGVGV